MYQVFVTAQMADGSTFRDVVNARDERDAARQVEEMLGEENVCSVEAVRL